jgi:adenosylmethionine-8-amino-7-oxononanoate aminotransferase
MSVSDDSVFTKAFPALLFPVDRVHPPYCYRCPMNLRRETCGIDCLGDLDNRLKSGGDQIAAVLVEPMLQGAGGMIMWPREFLDGVRQLCYRHGVLMIADEVLTGFGRTGRMFACEHASVTPDIICLSKALTAGYLPLAVTAVTNAVYEALSSEDQQRSSTAIRSRPTPSPAPSRSRAWTSSRKATCSRVSRASSVSCARVSRRSRSVPS